MPSILWYELREFVDVPYHIFSKMFIEKENEHQQLTLF